ncbi:von Willebrand factor type A [Methylobacterium sp. 4-46]|uniref:vWA domain-containing protein n=1 Tax=unclassified Methylobacterium TaxID=2615210 RepID=UPI000152D5E5|nr:MULTISPECIES: vWA domain-containing protein [Methylobacterium]ACA15903.1 von Willebrand factor type A [Methylobacterium sp. 4-46]WFT81620.1 VWA domain-containing protein [Methylobacterium nodulans]
MSDALTLLRPWWLLALPLLGLLAWRAAFRAAPLGDWVRAIEPRLLAGLTARGAVLPGRRRAGQAALLATAALLALALAGPAVQRGDAAGFRNLDATILVMDLSRSVAEGGRLDEVRGVAQSLAEAAGTRQVALVVYAGDAYLAATPTTDREALGTILFALDGATVPDRGSRPARGLALARRTLAEMGAVGADVVLVSDGGGVDEAARREASGLSGDGHRLHALFVPTPALPPEAPRPDRPALDRLAAAGGGVAADLDAPAPVLGAVGETAARHLADGGLAVLAWQDLGRWLLLGALAPALLLFRRGA